MASHALRRRLGLATVIVVAGAVALALLRYRHTERTTVVSAGTDGWNGATVQWSDDAVRIRSADDDGLMNTTEVELFGLRGETLAFQVVVAATDQPLQGVTVTLPDIEGVRTDRFVTFELPMKRRSGGTHPRVSLGWNEGARPPTPAPGSTIVDPLIPIRLTDHPAAPGATPPWDYPMTVPAGRRRVLWVELFITRAARPGTHRATITVASPSGSTALPMTLEIGRRHLPYAAAKTMVFVAPDTIAERVGERTVSQTLQLLHRHHLTPVLPLNTAAQLDRSPMKELLTGELFTEEAGYRGAGRGVGSDLVVLGIYGTLGMPEDEQLIEVDRILERLDELAPKADRFLYAVDEECDSPRGPAWRRTLAQSATERLAALEVGHTCSIPPNEQDVDLVMMFASAYRPALARDTDKRVWIYNGVLPNTGSFLSDGWDVGLRANPWIQAHHGIERWFYWESVFWNDGNRGGLGPYDPFATAETFHNADGDHANGDGVLVYPGQQRRDGYLDLGAERTLPSFRLAQWRRGIQDVGYLTLAEEVAPARTRAIRAELVGEAFSADRAPRFPVTPEPWRRARRQLFELLR